MASAAAERGAHVLLEKPVAVDAAQFAKMQAACRAAGVHLIDGTMFSHHERLATLLKLLGSEAVGLRVPPTVRAEHRAPFPPWRANS